MTDVNHADVRFLSLAAMREAHSELLKRQREADDTGQAATQLLAAVEDFIARGQATGALLDEDKERQAAQTLLDYWVTRLYRLGREPDSATLADFNPDLAPELPDQPCPYVGLEAFREEDQRFFFGRRRLLDELIAKLKARRLVAVVGKSGSGKSSLVRSGLISALKLKGGALPDSERARYIVMVPGTDPLSNLAQAIRSSFMESSDGSQSPDGGKLLAIEERLKSGSNGLTGLLRELTSDPVVLVVDQFEETFTLCRDQAIRERFVNNILGLIGAGTGGSSGDKMHEARAWVILTMREDFVDKVATIPALNEAFIDGRVDMRALDLNELREAILGPAAEVGLKFEEGIVDDLATSILGQGGGLPLLQFALLKLWEGRDRNRITWEVYRQVGSPPEALQHSADKVFDELGEDKDVARSIFTRLVTPNEVTGFTRNRLRRSDVYPASVSPQRVDNVLNEFEKARLIKITAKGTKDEQVEVAHEALITNWERLKGWLDEARYDLRQRRRLRDDAAGWQAGDETLLLRGTRLAEAEEMLPDLDENTRQFVLASREAAEAAERAREEARQRELTQTRTLADEQRRRAEAEARSARRLLWLVVVIGLAALMAAGFALIALDQRNVAEQEKIEADNARATAVSAQSTSDALRATAEVARATAETESQIEHSRALAGRAISELADNWGFSILIALEAQSITHTVESEDAMRRALLTRSAAAHLGSISGVHFSPKDERIVTAGDDGLVKVWEITETAIISPDVQPVELSGHQGPVNSAQFSSDGGHIITAGSDGTARIWDASTGTQQITLTHPTDAVNSAQFVGNARAITLGDDGIARLWDTKTGREITQLGGVTFAVSSAEASPDGRRIITANDDLTARVWDADRGRQIAELRGHTKGLTAAHFAPDGKLIVTASSDGTARVWDAATGGQIAELRLSKELPLPDIGVLSIELSTDGKYVLAALTDYHARIWDVAKGTELARLRERETLKSAHFSPNGKRVLLLTDPAVRIWEWNSQERKQAAVMRGHTGPINSAEFSPDSARVVTAGDDGKAFIHLVDVAEVERLAKELVVKEDLKWTCDERVDILHENLTCPTPEPAATSAPNP